ncbi:D-erythrulose reductase [Exaiptasia diaphana]|nr:D-erythrulose reductase [Exaiptasia diaphana]
MTAHIYKAVARKMVDGGYGGAIVNISSLGSTRAFGTLGTCCCAKAGLDILTKVMALELGPHKPLCVDLGNIEEAMKAIEAQDDIHLVVNNAAVPSQAAFLDIKPEDFDK